MDWIPTHIVVVTDATGRISVDVVFADLDPNGNGPAYTLEEWRASASSDWAVEDGRWYWRVSPNDNSTVEVVDAFVAGETWQRVFGDACPTTLVQEYDLGPDGLDEWVGACEQDAEIDEDSRWHAIAVAVIGSAINELTTTQPRGEE